MDIHINFMKQQVIKSYQSILLELKTTYFNPKEPFLYNITEEKVKIINYNNNNNDNNNTILQTNKVSLSSLPLRSSRMVRRIYVFTNNSELGRYYKLGWILDDDIDNCMICNYLFQKNNFNFIFKSDKHHCRACGNIICSSCSSTGYLKGITSSLSSESFSSSPSSSPSSPPSAAGAAAAKHTVCNLCNYGQDEIEIFITTQCNFITISQLIPRMKWVYNNGIKFDDDNYLKPTLGLWRYGVVKSIKVPLSLLFLARLQRNQQQLQQQLTTLSCIYVYISSFVPYNNNGSKSYNTENIYMLIDNEIKKNKNKDDIFTVTVHPNVLVEYYKDLHETRLIRNKVNINLYTFIYIYIHVYTCI